MVRQSDPDYCAGSKQLIPFDHDRSQTFQAAGVDDNMWYHVCLECGRLVALRGNVQYPHGTTPQRIHDDRKIGLINHFRRTQGMERLDGGTTLRLLNRTQLKAG